MSENRENLRRKMSERAVIASGHARVDCTIVDLSSSGARLRLGTGVFLARDCTLSASLFADAVAGRIVWRRGGEIGFRFNARSAVRRESGSGRPKTASTATGAWFGRR